MGLRCELCGFGINWSFGCFKLHGTVFYNVESGIVHSIYLLLVSTGYNRG